MIKYLSAPVIVGGLLLLLQAGPVAADSSMEISRLIERFSSGHLEKRKASVKAVAAYRTEAVPYLIEALKSPNFSIKSNAAEALGEIGDQRGVEPLVAILPLPAAVAALGKIGGPSAIDALGKMLIQLPEIYPSGYGHTAENLAVGVLGSFGPAGVEPLARALATRDQYVRGNVADALGRLRDPRAVEALIGALPMRQAAIALGMIGDPRAIVPLLQLVLKNRSESAECALQQIGFDLIPPLHGLVDGLPFSGDVTMLTDRIVALLASRKRDERLLAEFAVERIGRFAVPSLIKALNDKNARLRRAAVELLERVRDSRGEEALIAALLDSDPLVVARAAHALGEIGSRKAMAPLMKLAGTGSKFERRSAVWAIARIGDPQGSALLFELRNDRDEYVRRIATGRGQDIK